MRRIGAGFAAIAVVAALFALGTSTAGAAGERDGSKAELAAGSCSALHIDVPAAPNGVYWLQTPTMIAPRQFYCDMTTDGGGWVLIGRGREGWTFRASGQGNQSQLANTPNDFSPAAYDDATVDALLDGGRPDALTDGIRIRRAANSAGTSWQEVRWNLRPGTASFPGTADWSWAFGGGMELSSSSINGVVSGESNTTDNSVALPGGSVVGSPNGLNRWITYPWTAHNRKAGFSYGAGVEGSNSPTDHLWEYANEGNAVPFAQVFIRPQISSTAGYSTIPDTGLAAEEGDNILNSRPQALGWGVETNFDPNDQYPNLDSLVMGFAEIGNTVFVGGEFQHVRNGYAAPLVSQPYLAAFNRDTGAWIPGFAPQIDGTVFDVRATPDGKLLIGGSFSNVNGQPGTAGLAAINPLSGAVDPSWSANLTRNGTPLRPLARTMLVDGSWLYVGGYFNEVVGGVPAVPAFGVGNIARFSLANGAPDPSWRPVFESTPYHLSMSDDHSRLWAVGNFDEVNGTPAKQIAAVQTQGYARNEPANMQSWEPSTTNPDRYYQYAIDEYQGSVFMGGSEHNLHQYDLNYNRIGSSITRYGGDFQVITAKDGFIYAGCHCTDWVYSGGTNDWPQPDIADYSSVDSIRSFGAWDATTSEYRNDFQPQLSTTVGEGPWEMFEDSQSCMWVGGDFTSGGWNGSGFDYVGGFARFCEKDHTAPPTPSNVNAWSSATGPKLSWDPVVDESGSTVRYEILRDDRVVGTEYGTYFNDTSGVTGGRYFVRAVDSDDNRSATTWVRGVEEPNAQPITAGQSWRHSTTAVPGWNTLLGNVAAWPSDPSPLGWGLGEQTTLADHAVTHYFAADFSLPSLAPVGTLELRVKADDAAVVYLNGHEVARSNLPFGPPSPSTLAYSAKTGTPGWQTFNLPVDDLLAGNNRVGVELHQASVNDSDAFFDAEMTVRPKTADVTSPTTPTLTGSSPSDSAASLSWTPSTDDTAVALYRLKRNGVTIAYRNRWNTLAYSDQMLAAGTTYEYSVDAIDESGNASAASTVFVTTQGGVTPGDFVAVGDSWRILTTPPPAGWTDVGFNDAGWQLGAAPFGAGPGVTTTVSLAGVTQYGARNFVVPDPSAFVMMELNITADDGAAVYLNGQEIARTNLPFGPPSPTTPAWAPVIGTPTTYKYLVPPDMLLPGVNRLAVELHQTAANDVDGYFSASLTGSGPTIDATPPTAPTLSATPVNSSVVQLNYPGATDNVGVAVYRIQRDGVTITYRNGTSSLGYRDQQLQSGATYTYTIVAIDLAGNESAASTAAVTLP